MHNLKSAETIEMKTRKELQELQRMHVVKLKEEIGRLQRENEVLKAAFDKEAGSTNTVAVQLQRIEWQHSEERARLRRELEALQADRRQLRRQLKVVGGGGDAAAQAAARRLSILEQAKENADESVLREREARACISAENAELVAEIRQLRQRYGLDDLMDQAGATDSAGSGRGLPSAATSATAPGGIDDGPRGHAPLSSSTPKFDRSDRARPDSGAPRVGVTGPHTTDACHGSGDGTGVLPATAAGVTVTVTTWSDLLQETKALQSQLQQQEGSRRETLAALRRAGARLGPDPESIHQFNTVLDGMAPAESALGTTTALAQLIAVEDRLAAMQHQRTALEEHLAYLNRVHADRAVVDERSITASSLLSRRVWALEEHTAAVREALHYRGGGFVDVSSVGALGGTNRTERSLSVSSTDGHTDWLDSHESLAPQPSPVSTVSGPAKFSY